MSLCFLIYNDTQGISSPNDLIQIMNIGNQLYSTLSWLARQAQPTFLFNNSLTFYKCCNLKSLLIYLNHLVIHPNCLWSHNSERGSDHFWRNGFLCLRNLRTDQFFGSLLSSSKFVNSISHPLLSDSISKWFVQRYIERLKKEAVTVSVTWASNES